MAQGSGSAGSTRCVDPVALDLKGFGHTMFLFINYLLVYLLSTQPSNYSSAALSLYIKLTTALYIYLSLLNIKVKILFIIFSN